MTINFATVGGGGMLCNLQQIQGHHSFCFVHVQDRILSGTILTFTKENVWIQGVVVRILTLEKKTEFRCQPNTHEAYSRRIRIR